MSGSQEAGRIDPGADTPPVDAADAPAEGRAMLLLLVAAALFLNFPMLAVVEAVRAAGWPLATAIYLFGVWALLIAGAAIAFERRRA